MSRDGGGLEESGRETSLGSARDNEKGTHW